MGTTPISEEHPHPVDPSTTRVGWIGAGVMGGSMCGHVLRHGYRVTLHTRTRAKAAALLAQGAVWAETPGGVAEASEVVFTIVGFPDDVRAVYREANGLLAAARPGQMLVDMTTSPPALAREIHAQAAGRGISTIDAPVSGGDVGAREARLSIMVGGLEGSVQSIMPLLRTMGHHVVHQGGPGAGQHAKLCNQIAIAGTMIGVCESLLYGARAGLSLHRMLASIRTGAAGCWTLEHLAPRIIQRNFDPGFYVDHFIKDMGLALDEAARMQLVLPGLALVHQLYHAVQALGHGKSGTHALMLALERLSNVENRPGSTPSPSD